MGAGNFNPLQLGQVTYNINSLAKQSAVSAYLNHQKIDEHHT